MTRNKIEQIRKSAILIADELDRLGQDELASRIDQEIIEALSLSVHKYAQQEEIEIEIPEEERLMLEDILFSLQDSLRNSS